jgi:hypothetical protein
VYFGNHRNQNTLRERNAEVFNVNAGIYIYIYSGYDIYIYIYIYRNHFALRLGLLT